MKFRITHVIKEDPVEPEVESYEFEGDSWQDAYDEVARKRESDGYRSYQVERVDL